MYTMKLNNLLIKLQEVEHSTESGIILDQEGDKFISYGILEQDANVWDGINNEPPFTIPAGAKIIYSKDKVIPLQNDLGVVEYHNVICWEA